MNIEDHQLKLDDDTVPWRLVQPAKAGKQWCVLWLQGWTSSMNSHLEGVKRMVETTEVAFATLDYAGHGLHKQSLETSTRQQQLTEVTAVFDELQKRGYKNIITIGGSFGGYMTALLTGRRPVHAAMLRAPANYPDEEFSIPYAETLRYKAHDRHTELRKALRHSTENSALEAISRYKGFVYILEHELDTAVPRDIPQAYFKVAKHGNYLIVPKTEHSPKLMPNPKQHFRYIEHVLISLIKAIQLQDELG